MTLEEVEQLLKSVNGNRPQVNQSMNFNAPIGQQIAHVDKIEAHFDKDMGMQLVNVEGIESFEKSHFNRDEIKDEEMFHFVHPEIEDKEAWRIHNVVKRLVTQHGIQEICRYLRELERERKVLLPQMASVTYAELVRMGMPQGEGYSEKYFMKHYNL